MSDYNIKDTMSFRFCHVLKSRFANTHCCHKCIADDEYFFYIEMIDKDGNRHFIYEDEEKYKNFEENFHSKRFTSFCEFFTTEELAIEDRGGLKFKYYVRRDASDYQIANVEETLKALEALNSCTKLCDRYVYWSHYDKVVDYHMEQE